MTSDKYAALALKSRLPCYVDSCLYYAIRTYVLCCTAYIQYWHAPMLIFAAPPDPDTSSVIFRPFHYAGLRLGNTTFIPKFLINFTSLLLYFCVDLDAMPFSALFLCIALDATLVCLFLYYTALDIILVLP